MWEEGARCWSKGFYFFLSCLTSDYKFKLELSWEHFPQKRCQTRTNPWENQQVTTCWEIWSPCLSDQDGIEDEVPEAELHSLVLFVLIMGNLQHLVHEIGIRASCGASVPIRLHSLVLLRPHHGEPETFSSWNWHQSDLRRWCSYPGFTSLSSSSSSWGTCDI